MKRNSKMESWPCHSQKKKAKKSGIRDRLGNSSERARERPLLSSGGNRPPESNISRKRERFLASTWRHVIPPPPVLSVVAKENETSTKCLMAGGALFSLSPVLRPTSCLERKSTIFRNRLIWGDSVRFDLVINIHQQTPVIQIILWL